MVSSVPASGPVLHPTDFSEAAAAARPHALYLAGLFGTDLHLLHVEENDEERANGDFPGTEDGWTDVESWLAGSPATGARAAGEVTAPGVRQETRRGPEPAEAILSYAEEVDAGAICMGTHGRGGIRRLVVGSVTEQVMRETRRPVLTVREGLRGWGEDGPLRLLVGADLSPMMQPSLAWAGVLAAASGAELTAVHVVTSHAGAAERDQLQKIHAAFRNLGLDEVDLDAELLIGDPDLRIREMAEEEDADLLVTASHGRSGPVRMLVGSVTESLVRRAPCPVFTVSEPPPAVGGRGG